MGLRSKEMLDDDDYDADVVIFFLLCRSNILDETLDELLDRTAETVGPSLQEGRRRESDPGVQEGLEGADTLSRIKSLG